MKTTPTGPNRFDKRRQARLKELARTGPFVEGSLVGVQHPRCQHVAWRLTFKVKAKTRTVYVPVDMVEEVKRMDVRLSATKKLIREVTRNSLALIHGHVAARRAASRGRRRTTNRSARQTLAVVRHCFPQLNRWFDELPDPRRQELCVYPGRHLWWQMVLTFLLRGGSRNAFDGDRNSGQLPENLRQLCAHDWDEARLGQRRTVTCSDNAQHHAARVPVAAVAQIPVAMVRRLMQMRLVDERPAVRALVDDRGRWNPPGSRPAHPADAKRATGMSWRPSWSAREGTMFSSDDGVRDMHDPVRGQRGLRTQRLPAAGRAPAARSFPDSPSVCCWMGFYPVQSVFDSVHGVWLEVHRHAARGAPTHRLG